MDWDPQSETFPEEDRQTLSGIGFDVGVFVGKGAFGKVFRGVCNERASKAYEIHLNADQSSGASSSTWSTPTRQMRTVSLNGRPFAIKWIKPQPRANVLTEGKVLMNLNHPNIVDILFVTKIRFKNHYVIMEYLNGNTLSEFIVSHQRNRTRIPEPEAKSLVIELIEGLRYLHSHRVLHKDISVVNLMFHTPDPSDPHSVRVLKYVDFNLSQELSQEMPKEMFDNLSRDDIRMLGFTYDAIKRHTNFVDKTFEKDLNDICVRMKSTNFNNIDEVYHTLMDVFAKTGR